LHRGLSPWGGIVPWRPERGKQQGGEKARKVKKRERNIRTSTGGNRPYSVQVATVQKGLQKGQGGWQGKQRKTSKEMVLSPKVKLAFPSHEQKKAAEGKKCGKRPGGGG